MQCEVVPYFAIAKGEGVVCCERLVGGGVQSVDDQAMEPKDEHCVGRRVDDDALGVVGAAVLGAVEEGADVVEGAGGAAVEEDAAHNNRIFNSNGQRESVYKLATREGNVEEKKHSTWFIILSRV